MSRKQLQHLLWYHLFLSLVLQPMEALKQSIMQINNRGQMPPTAAVSKAAQVQAQAKGYELVLQREPENQVELEGDAGAAADARWAGFVCNGLLEL
jgi:hypothetical protein